MVHRIFFSQFIDQPSAHRLVPRRADLWAAFSKPFLLLQLNPLPRRVPQHHVKTTGRIIRMKHSRKSLVPVKKIVLFCQPLYLIPHPSWQTVWVSYNTSEFSSVSG